MGTIFPFRNEFILTNPELQEIRTHLGIINDIIRSLAVEYDLALVDAELFFLNIDSGFPFNGINMGTGFLFQVERMG